MGFNQCEVFYEIEMTPEKLREIAAEIEKLSKSDLFLTGQIIRYKINHKFAFVYKPEVRFSNAIYESRDSFTQDGDADEITDVVPTTAPKSNGMFFRN